MKKIKMQYVEPVMMVVRIGGDDYVCDDVEGPGFGTNAGQDMEQWVKGEVDDDSMWSNEDISVSTSSDIWNSAW